MNVLEILIGVIITLIIVFSSLFSYYKGVKKSQINLLVTICFYGVFIISSIFINSSILLPFIKEKLNIITNQYDNIILFLSNIILKILYFILLKFISIIIYKIIVKNIKNKKELKASLIGFLKGIRENKESNEIVILCFGGSLGAEKINDCAYLICKNILTERKNVKFVWGCGKREYQRCKSMLENINVDNVELKEYIYNMPEIISTADIVICRSGAMSVAEMSYSGKCTVFIPSPNVTDNHQFKNAKVLSDKNAAILVEEKDIDTVIPILNELIDNKSKRDELEIKIAESCIRDSNKRILNEIKKVSNS